MPTPPLQGVILAAGGGSRMGPLAECCPKALLPVGPKSLLAHHLDTMRALHVAEVFIVVGHLGDAIRRAVDRMDHGMTIHFVEQKRREGLAHAVGMLEASLSGPFVLLLSDIYFEFNHLDTLVARFHDHAAGAAIAVRDETDPASVRRNFSVASDETGRVHRVVEKPVAPESLRKGCGLYCFTPAIFEAIRNTPRSALRNEYELTDAIQVLIDTNTPVIEAHVVDWDVNITTPDDLLACNHHILARENLPVLTGKDCQIVPEATLVKTVLGDHVRVVAPCRLDACVVLSGTVIDAPVNLANRVLYPGFDFGNG